MGLGLRIYFIEHGDRIVPVSQAKYLRLYDRAEALPHVAGTRVRCAKITVQLVDNEAPMIALARGQAPALAGGLAVLIAFAVAQRFTGRGVRREVELAQARATFTAMVSHELRTPVAAIRMYAEVLEHRLVDDPAKVAHYYRVIGGEAQRLERLVEDLLSLGSLERGARSFARAPTHSPDSWRRPWPGPRLRRRMKHRMAWSWCWTYRILDRGRRAGTIAFWTMAAADGFVQVSSLHVFLDLRGRGIAGSLVEATRDVAAGRELRGIWVPTHWSWQPAVRYYLGRGMWVRSWKHSLVFVDAPDLPRWRLDVEVDRARLAVVCGGEEIAGIRAARPQDAPCRPDEQSSSR